MSCLLFVILIKYSKKNLISSFSSVFPGRNSSSTTIITEASSGNYYIFDSNFRKLRFNEDGGAIFMNSRLNVYLLIEKSLFDDCYAFVRGGAIYLSIPSGTVAIMKTCGYQCFVDVSSVGQFLHQRTSTSVVSQSNLLSLSYCSTQAGSRSSVCYLQNGIHQHSNINTSNNQVNQVSSFGFNSIAYTVISYWTCTNNYAHSNHCFSIISASSTSTIRFTNMVANNSPGAIIYLNTATSIFHNSSFIDNEGTLFNAVGSISFSPTVRHCIIKHNLIYSLFTVLAITFSQTFSITTGTSTLPISHYSTYLCYTNDYFSIVGGLSVCTPAQTIPPNCLAQSTDSNFLKLTNFFSLLIIPLFIQ